MRGVTSGLILQVVRNVTNGVTPARIVATGYAEGGALAKLAAVWAGAAFAEAQIRSINFGAPRVGTDRWGNCCIHLLGGWRARCSGSIMHVACMQACREIYICACGLGTV